MKHPCNNQQQPPIVCTGNVLPQPSPHRCLRRRRGGRVERTSICALHASVKQAAGNHEELLPHHFVHGVTHALKLSGHGTEAGDALYLLRLQLRVRVTQQLEGAEEVATAQLLLHKSRRLTYAGNMQRNVQKQAEPLPAPRQPGDLTT